ncbi:hypothetical protein F4821DRAFT_139418 [Hypoxylon rubiginosum]|uniref:Uncharacterized protein n=1 Tax=Hypoxylon rubiginosum TaxID=110542 RepID=A0ACC0D0D3_9PEZI|nr:hypothetical protein F4821DRAFT_139418 [Hypoxylon rubiginosum]
MVYILYAAVNAAESLAANSLQAARDKKPQARVSAFTEWPNNPTISSFRFDTEDILSSIHAENYLSTTHSPALSSRSLFVTKKGRMGLGKSVQCGDALVLVTTCQLPYALRPVSVEKTYTLVQPIVLEVVMLGEEWSADNKSGLETIKIV